MFIKELDINKQNKIIKILTKFVLHFKTRNLYKYDNNQFCKQCSRDKDHFKTFENFKEQGICDHCLEIKDCIDFEVAYLLDGCKNEFGFYKPREKEFISFLKEKNIPFLRGYKTLGDFIDGKETISLNHVNDKIRDLVLLFQNPIYNLNYDVFKRGYQGGYSLMNQFNNYKEYNSFIKGMNEYVKKSEYVDSVIVKHDELFPYTKEHMKSLLNLKNSLSYNNSTQIIDYIESIPEDRFNSKHEIELFLYFNIIDLALKHIKTKPDGGYTYSLFLIEGFILDNAREQTFMGQNIIGLLREARKYGLSIIMVNNRNEYVRP